MKWKVDPDPNRVRKLELALENCLMLARRKRANRHTYNADGTVTPRPPKSDDTDWDHVIRFCHDAGVQESILRTQGEPNEQQ